MYYQITSTLAIGYHTNNLSPFRKVMPPCDYVSLSLLIWQRIPFTADAVHKFNVGKVSAAIFQLVNLRYVEVPISLHPWLSAKSLHRQGQNTHCSVPHTKYM